MNKKIGIIKKNVIDTLHLNLSEEKDIFIGKDNIEHMKLRHPEDYNKYGSKLSDIIKHPTYLARNEKKKSIEYIKEYVIDNECVLVVVKASRK